MDAAAKAHQKEQQGRADVLALAHISESSKFDYFTLTVSLAVCGYLAQTNQYARLGCNRETFQLGVLVIFVLSAGLGFACLWFKLKNIAGSIRAIQLSHTETALAKQGFAIDAFEKYRLLRASSIALLILGICAYATVRVWAAYQSNGWTSVH
jgi:hypothetical protein